MQPKEALLVLRSLAQGVDPRNTSVKLPADHLCCRPYERQAIETAITALEQLENRNRPFPDNYGNAWSQEEINFLKDANAAGLQPSQMGAHLKRTTGSVRSKLEKLGLRSPQHGKVA